jgi:hypothetical protein
MIILGLVLVLLALWIYMTAEDVMIKPLGFIIGVVGLYIILRYRPKKKELGVNGGDSFDQSE